MEYFLLALSWAIFYTLHSFLAASKLKRKLTKPLGNTFKWYRLFYSLFSSLFFLGILYQSLFVPLKILIPIQSFHRYIGYFLATLGTMIAVKASKQISLSSFIGINVNTDSKHPKLVTEGWYGRMRHPLYAGLILIFGGYFLASGSYSAAIHLICLVLYLPFGIYFEEQKLFQIYGEQYRSYCKNIPAIFPLFYKRKKRV